MSCQYKTDKHEWHDADLYMILDAITGNNIKLKSGASIGVFKEIKETIQPEWEERAVIVKLNCIIPVKIEVK